MNGFLTGKDGQPIYVVGMQTHNSSVGTRLMPRAVAAARLYGANTLEVPVYWFMLEPEKGRYDTSSVRETVDLARKAGLHLILLWFATSKNGHPNYAPEYVKTDPATYAVAIGADGAPVASLSPHCAATRERDCAAFAALMRFLRKYDGAQRTVLAVQVENEMGLANTDRDYSPLAQAAYQEPLDARVLSLAPMEGATGEDTWLGRFGRRANEAFSAWHHALYIEAVAEAGKAEYPLPLFTNVMVGENGLEEAGHSYNAGAPVSWMIDLWKLAAPHLDLICPDIYNEPADEYKRIIHAYAREDNALLIPESPFGGEANAINCFRAVELGAIGVGSFGVESALHEDGTLRDEARPVALSYRAIASLAPLLIRYRGTGRVHALVQEEFSHHQHLLLPQYHIDARFIRSQPDMPGLGADPDPRLPENAWMKDERGRALIVQTDEHEFYLAGAGVSVYFTRRPDAADPLYFAHLCSRQSSQLNFLTVEEGHFEGDAWVTDRYRNGDESNFGVTLLGASPVRIRLNPRMW